MDTQVAGITVEKVFSFFSFFHFYLIPLEQSFYKVVHSLFSPVFLFCLHMDVWRGFSIFYCLNTAVQIAFSQW